MIYIGLPKANRPQVIEHYVKHNGIKKMVVFSPKRFQLNAEFTIPFELIEWDSIIQYKYFYRLLQEIDSNTLLVINECLRTTNRADLYYNCLRNYLTRTEHQLIFNRFPALESFNDFMILVDLDTRSRWRKSSFEGINEKLNISITDVKLEMKSIDIATDEKTKTTYAKKKADLINSIGARDPHIIPRDLHLVAGKHKMKAAKELASPWVGRNNRFKIEALKTYDESNDNRNVFEFCHSYRDWSDYLTASEACSLSAMVSDLKVDAWYFKRFSDWMEMQQDVCTKIRNR
jgi:hypothetical protein